MQNAYDSFGGVAGIIERVNSIDSGKAAVLSDSEVEKIQKSYSKAREKAEAEMNTAISGNKKSVNRHRNYWSAM